jgi:indolepyruvate ferredoxin oxidoreductase beta subunit
MSDKFTNVLFAGIGGQGVLKASDIFAEVVFRAGFDVKKAEVHGMSQRGGSVTSDVRFGEKVQSPMIPSGEADFLVVLSEDEIERNRPSLAADGVLVDCTMIDKEKLPHPKSLNVALLGALSTKMDIEQNFWIEAIEANLPKKLHEINRKSFEFGKESAK